METAKILVIGNLMLILILCLFYYINSNLVYSCYNKNYTPIELSNNFTYENAYFPQEIQCNYKTDIENCFVNKIVNFNYTVYYKGYLVFNQDFNCKIILNDYVYDTNNTNLVCDDIHKIYYLKNEDNYYCSNNKNDRQNLNLDYFFKTCKNYYSPLIFFQYFFMCFFSIYVNANLPSKNNIKLVNNEVFCLFLLLIGFFYAFGILISYDMLI